MMYKTTALLLVAVFYIEGSRFSDRILDEMIEDYEEQRVKRDDIDPRFCGDTGLKCYKCKECHDHLQFGLCIDDGSTIAKCLCKWGWTGTNARRIDDVGVSAWSRNRVRASNCKQPCHYTHDVWNPQCLSGGPNIPLCDFEECKTKFGTCKNDVCVPDCDITECLSKYGVCKKGKCVPTCNDAECQAKGGKCVEGKCKICCKNIKTTNNRYTNIVTREVISNFNQHCNERCHSDCTSPAPIDTCDPKCSNSGGKCDTATGRCQCCKDFTGPRAGFVGENLYADYCDVYCKHDSGSQKNMLCVNSNYVERLRNK